MRGIAIIFIVLGHSIYNSGEGFPLLLENLLRGGTALFVFISGYFFHRIFYKDFDYSKFMKNKVQNVLYPFFSRVSDRFILFVFALDFYGAPVARQTLAEYFLHHT